MTDDARPAPLSLAPRLLLVVAFAVVLGLRMPDVILHGRMWAEEGTIFYTRAAAMPWRQALFLPYGGYLNIVANGAPILARHVVHLEYVPWVMSGVGLVFQCLPAVLLVSSPDPWLRSRVALVGALLVISTAPLVEEVWLQTLHSQFHLALCCALILALDVPGRKLAWFGGLLLVMAPLCGPSAAVLLPLFVARAALDRSWARLFQGLALAAGTALQLGLFYQHSVGRSYGIGPVVLLCVIYIKQILVPFAGRTLAEQASGTVQGELADGVFPWQAVLVTLGAFGIFALALVRRRLAAPVWLFLAACLTAWIAYFGAIDGGPNLMIIGNEGRYTFLPEVLAALALVGVATGRTAPDRWIARAGVVWLVLVGIGDLSAPSAAKTGTSWLDEVKLWRQDPTHPIAIWPDGWSMTLDHE